MSKDCSDCNHLVAELTACKAEYAEYVKGKPGEWYVVQLQAETERLKAAIEQIVDIAQTELKGKK